MLLSCYLSYVKHNVTQDSYQWTTHEITFLYSNGNCLPCSLKILRRVLSLADFGGWRRSAKISFSKMKNSAKLNAPKINSLNSFNALKKPCILRNVSAMVIQTFKLISLVSKNIREYRLWQTRILMKQCFVVHGFLFCSVFVFQFLLRIKVSVTMIQGVLKQFSRENRRSLV